MQANQPPSESQPSNARLAALRYNTIRRYQAGQRSGAHAYLVEELLGGWDA